MYISRIDIENFRNYKKFSMELKPFVTIIGENNVGKSNLLDAISLVLSNDIMSLKKRTLDIEDFNFEAVKEFKTQFISNKEKVEFPGIRIDLYFSELDADQEAVLDDCWFDKGHTQARVSYIYSFKTSKKKKVLESMINILDNAPSSDPEELIKYIDLPINGYEYEIVGGIYDHKVDRYDLKMLTMEYLDALRDAKRELNSNSDKKLLYKILNDRNLDSFQGIKSILVELDKVIKQDEDVLQSLKGDIEDYLDKISLQTETSLNQVDFQFSSIELSEILKKIGMQYGADAVSIERNGLGRNNLLYIAVVLAHLYEKENTFFRLIAIEEPEAHLCPIVQKHLAKNIKDESELGKQQVIITTHSTHIASYLELDNTVVLFNEKGKINSHYLLDGFGKSAEDTKIKKYLQKWLNATNSTMFFSRKLILVEGIAEEILIPAFYEWEYHNTLEKVNCQVVNVNGVAFKNFLEVIKRGYFIKTAVLTDSDKSKKTNGRAKGLKDKYDAEKNIGVFVTTSDTFEKEIFIDNKTSKSKKKFLLEVLGKIRPVKCNKVFIKNQQDEFDIEELFECVEEYKSEFAFELSEQLNSIKVTKTAKSNFKIPQYILEAFKFINEEV